MATDFFTNIKEKLLDLIYEEFGAGEVNVLLEDNIERFGLGKTQVILDAGEKTLLKRLGLFWIYEYNINMIVRKRIISDEDADGEIMFITEKLTERLVERNANRNQQSNGLWFDSRIDGIDAPENVALTAEIEDEDEITDIARQAVIRWVGSIGYCPETGL